MSFFVVAGAVTVHSAWTLDSSAKSVSVSVRRWTLYPRFEAKRKTIFAILARNNSREIAALAFCGLQAGRF